MRTILFAIILLFPCLLFADDIQYDGEPVIVTCAVESGNRAWSVSYCATGLKIITKTNYFRNSNECHLRLDGSKIYKKLDFNRCYVTNISCKGVKQ